MIKMDVFFNSYMESHNIGKKALAKKLGVHINTLRHWMECDTYPTTDKAQDVLSKLGYDLVIIEKSKEESSNVAATKPVWTFNQYEKTIFKRGRDSAIREISKSFDKIAASV